MQFLQRSRLTNQLATYYAGCCDGDWEHEFGVKLAGFGSSWHMIIDTPCSQDYTDLRAFESLDIPPHTVREKDGAIFGSCEAGSLCELIHAMLRKAEEIAGNPSVLPDSPTGDDRLRVLDAWCAANQSTDDRYPRLVLGTLDNPGWTLSVELAGTGLHPQNVQESKSNTDSNDAWMVVQSHESTYRSFGGPKVLDQMLSAFLFWARAQ
ncbi:MAG: Imm53 family immunity protein [Planctomycetota bacterium]